MRAKVFSSDRDTFRKFATRWAAASMFRRARSSGFCVAIPTGQLPEPQMRYCWQAAAISAALAMNGRNPDTSGRGLRHKRWEP